MKAFVALVVGVAVVVVAGWIVRRHRRRPEMRDLSDRWRVEHAYDKTRGRDWWK